MIDALIMTGIVGCIVSAVVAGVAAARMRDITLQLVELELDEGSDLAEVERL